MRLNDYARRPRVSFRRAVALKPGDANTQHNLGWLMCQQTAIDEAVQLRQALGQSRLLGAAPRR
jgi:type IV pilus assembly protein PilF